MAELILYTYAKSSAAYRVRIALNIKGLNYQSRYIDLSQSHCENETPEYRQINPQAMVPTLCHGSLVLGQSLAIIDYLQEAFPAHCLYPNSAEARAMVRYVALSIACDIHPLNNIRVLHYLEQIGQSEQSKTQWYRHWIAQGFTALEQQFSQHPATAFCYGETPSLADLCLVPQVYNAIRFNCDLAPYPNIRRINQNCLKLQAFRQASPENQKDFVL